MYPEEVAVGFWFAEVFFFELDATVQYNHYFHVIQKVTFELRRAELGEYCSLFVIRATYTNDSLPIWLHDIFIMVGALF